MYHNNYIILLGNHFDEKAAEPLSQAIKVSKSSNYSIHGSIALTH